MTRHFHGAWLLALLLAGCGTLGGGGGPPAQPATERAAPVPDTASSGGRGGYYLDDGPGEHPPADLDAIADAVPRAEAPLARANRPYVALGERYTPMTQHQPYQARGVASWYGRRYHGQKTSSGEVYDMYGMTAAHPVLPIPSYVRVTNPDNGRSVVVRVNDRGPFRKDRLIDLSYAAAHKLRLVERGSGLVEVQVILPQAGASASYVQAGAFRQQENAEQLGRTLRGQGLAQNVEVQNWYNGAVHRVRLGPYSSHEAAEQAAGRIRQALGIEALVVSP